jgi:hypothetical protein
VAVAFVIIRFLLLRLLRLDCVLLLSFGYKAGKKDFIRQQLWRESHLSLRTEEGTLKTPVLGADARRSTAVVVQNPYTFDDAVVLAR